MTQDNRRVIGNKIAFLIAEGFFFFIRVRSRSSGSGGRAAAPGGSEPSTVITSHNGVGISPVFFPIFSFIRPIGKASPPEVTPRRLLFNVVTGAKPRSHRHRDGEGRGHGEEKGARDSPRSSRALLEAAGGRGEVAAKQKEDTKTTAVRIRLRTETTNPGAPRCSALPELSPRRAPLGFARKPISLPRATSSPPARSHLDGKMHKASRKGIERHREGHGDGVLRAKVTNPAGSVRVYTAPFPLAPPGNSEPCRKMKGTG